jgi:ribosomal protein S18 acetylase RimI-like enzyme
VTTPQIVRADSTDAGWIAELIGSAFQDLEATEWLVPDRGVRAGILPRNFEIYVEHALTYGEVNVTHDRTGAAVWIPRLDKLPAIPNYDDRLAAACGEAVDRFRHLDGLFDEHHPEPPHHHLAFLAVRPDRQRLGIGSALLAHHHAMLDRDGISAFLEASSTRSRDLYARHGYLPCGKEYGLPNGALFWPMWRDPATVHLN